MKHHTACLLLLTIFFASIYAGFTPASLVAYLRSITGKHTISGQFIELQGLDSITAIYQSTGKWLGLIGGDYWWYGNTNFQGDTTFNTHAIQYSQQGGIITLCSSWPNPTTGGALYDVSRLDATGLLTAGSTTNKNFLISLNFVAQGIAQLQNSGVTVMWRPFHENNGNWFWWGTTLMSNAQFVELWQYVHNYMTNTMKLNNIVWLWSVNSGMDNFARYPGAQYVDIVGHDLYTSDPNQGVGTYKSLSTLGKPVILAEYGAGNPGAGDKNFNETTLIRDIKSNMPNTLMWQQWWERWGMANVQGVYQALHDPWVLNRDDLKLSAEEFLATYQD